MESFYKEKVSEFQKNDAAALLENSMVPSSHFHLIYMNIARLATLSHDCGHLFKIIKRVIWRQI